MRQSGLDDYVNVVKGLKLQVQCICTYILRYTNTVASVVPCHVINMFILTLSLSCTDITTAGRNLYLHNQIIEL
jgi:hypothetical protein